MKDSAGVGERRLFAYLVLVLSALVVTVPFVWVIAAGFRTQISLLMGQFLFEPNLDAFREVLFSKTSDFLLNFQNSLIVGLASTFLCVVIGTLAGWSLHRMRWPGWVTIVAGPQAVAEAAASLSPSSPPPQIPTWDDVAAELEPVYRQAAAQTPRTGAERLGHGGVH